MLDPLSALAYISRAAAYRQRGQTDLALGDLQHALRMDPGNWRLFQERALTHRALGNASLAVADLDQAIRLNPASADLIHERGRAHQLQGNLELAFEDFGAAIGADPAFALAYDSRGSLLAQRGQFDQALDDFAEAIRRDADLGSAYLNRAAVWSRMGRFDRAVADCDAAIERNPEMGSAHLARGGVHAEQGAYEAARADFSRAVQLDPANAAAYRLRGQTALRCGDHARALADLDESLRLGPNTAATLFLRGTAYAALGRHDEALADLNQAVLLDPRYTTAYCNQRAVVHAGRGEYELALADYGITLQIDPTNVTALTGREQVVHALQARPAAEPPRPRKKPGGTTQIRLGQVTQEQPALAQAEAEKPPSEIPDQDDEPLTPTDDVLLEGDPERSTEAPPPQGETAPDVAVDPPAAAEEGGERPHGPVEARVAKVKRDAEMRERAMLWAAMRDKFKKADEAAAEKERKEHTPRERGQLGLSRRGLLLVAAALSVLALVGGGTYFLFFMERDIKVTAADVCKEYNANASAAAQRYKGRFAQVTGKLAVQTTKNDTQQIIMEGGESGGHIEFTLRPDDAKAVKAGQEVTLRGRLSARKDPEGKETTLLLSNCNLVKAR